MTTVIASIVVIGIIVFIHELGHFAAAKFSGVKVEIFSLGFGPRLWGFRLGETEYIISAIPLGGFVKMEGDSPDEGGEDVEPQYGERSFLGKSKRTRALIVAAGPAMNFLLAAIIYAGLAYHTGMAVFTTREIGIVEEGSPAQAAGLRAGDEITQVDGATVENWDAIISALDDGLGARLEVVVEREHHSETFNVDLSETGDVEEVGLGRYVPPVADSVVPGGPAEQAGLKAGDEIVEIEGYPIRTWQDISRIVEPAADVGLTIKWTRDDETMVSTITPEDTGGRGVIGISNDFVGEYELHPVGVFRSIDTGLRNAGWMSLQIFNLIRLLRAGYPLKEVVGGPVRIGQLAGETLRLGIGTFLAFIAAISAQLCIVNLMPIPVLDGGHLLILGVETLARRPVSMRQRIIAQQIGLALLIAFMVVVTMVDVSRLLGG